jgi:hypothetical protein
MKLRTKKSRYKIPPISQIIGMYVEGNQKHNQMCSYALYRVSLEEFFKAKTGALGFPTRYCIDHGGNMIEFDPIPDKPYIVKMRYVPPVQEF